MGLKSTANNLYVHFFHNFRKPFGYIQPFHVKTGKYYNNGWHKILLPFKICFENLFYLTLVFSAQGIEVAVHLFSAHTKQQAVVHSTLSCNLTRILPARYGLGLSACYLGCCWLLWIPVAFMSNQKGWIREKNFFLFCFLQFTTAKNLDQRLLSLNIYTIGIHSTYMYIVIM